MLTKYDFCITRSLDTGYLCLMYGQPSTKYILILTA